MTTILLLVIAAALLFDFVNGWNDSANAIATIVSTRVLAPLNAVLFAAVLNFFGALVSTKVAKTIGGGLVDPSVVTEPIVLAAMISAAAWVAFCTLWGLPVSGSHSLIGGLVGAAVAGVGMEALKWGGLTKVLLAIVISPVLGMLVGYVLVVLVYWIALLMRPRAVRLTFSFLQVLSSGFMAFTHGMNDAQKVMGVITLALFSAGKLAAIEVPIWVILLCGIVMGLGTAAGGWRVIRTLGSKLSDLKPIDGFAAETSAGLVLSLAAHWGTPVSTTHTITGSIIGVGAAKSVRSVKWMVGAKIINAWVFTLPATALLGYLLAAVLVRAHTYFK